MEGNNLPDKINAGNFLDSDNYESKMMDLGIKVALIEICSMLDSMPSNQLFSFLRESVALYLKEMGAFEVSLVECF